MDGHFRVRGFLLDTPDTQIVVHHRVQPADREFVLAQVDDRVSLADQRVFELVLLVQRGVRVDHRDVVLKDQQRFVLQCTAREQAPQVALAGGEPARSGSAAKSSGESIRRMASSAVSSKVVAKKTLSTRREALA